MQNPFTTFAMIFAVVFLACNVMSIYATALDPTERGHLSTIFASLNVTSVALADNSTQCPGAFAAFECNNAGFVTLMCAQ